MGAYGLAIGRVEAHDDIEQRRLGARIDVEAMRLQHVGIIGSDLVEPGADGGNVIVTMLALKPGLLSDVGRDVCGAIVVAPLAEQTEQLAIDADPVAWRIDLEDYLDVMVPPSSAVDKFSRGSVLVVGGSPRFIGAPAGSQRRGGGHGGEGPARRPYARFVKRIPRDTKGYLQPHGQSPTGRPGCNLQAAAAPDGRRKR